MNRLTRECLAAGAAVPLLFGCSSGEGQQPTNGVAPHATGTYSTKLYPGQQEYVRENFKRDIDYWKSRGVGKISNTKLVILSGHEAEFACPLGKDQQTVHYKASSMNSFCATKNTVIFTGISLHVQLSEGIGQKGADFELDHEVGYAVQYAKGDLKPSMLFDQERLPKIQRKAICLAGIIAKEFDERSVATVEGYLQKMPTDSPHPGTHLYADAYMQGVNIGNCDSLR